MITVLSYQLDRVADPRTEQVHANADEAECYVCPDCWKPGMPMICGQPDFGDPDDDDLCPEDCGHPTCPLCVEAWDAHECTPRPWWKRWLP